MKTHDLSAGVVHAMPTDLQAPLVADTRAAQAWEDITPLARNEWICWVLSAKMADTRKRRIERTVSELASGKRRPCCWVGCIHR